MKSADIILLLFSPDFLASYYCSGTMMKRAIQRQNEGRAQIVPFLPLRSAFWQNAPFAAPQIFSTDAQPLTNWPDRADVLHDLIMQVKRVVSEQLCSVFDPA